MIGYQTGLQTDSVLTYWSWTLSVFSGTENGVENRLKVGFSSTPPAVPSWVTTVQVTWSLSVFQTTHGRQRRGGGRRDDAGRKVGDAVVHGVVCGRAGV